MPHYPAKFHFEEVLWKPAAPIWRTATVSLTTSFESLSESWALRWERQFGTPSLAPVGKDQLPAGNKSDDGVDPLHEHGVTDGHFSQREAS